MALLNKTAERAILSLTLAVKVTVLVWLEVVKLTVEGLEVKLENDILGFIKKADLSREKEDQKLTRFAKGEKVDAMIINIDKGARKVYLSIKAMELEEEKKAMKDYGSTDSGASLGDILGAALEAKSEKKDKKTTSTKKS